SFIILVAVGLLVLSILLPNVFEAIVTGQGYFVKSKLYSTISEAQAPNFSDLALSFGAVTFWLSFAGIVLAAIRVPKNMTPYLIFIIVWAAIAMFMALSAARFMFNASPAFAIAGGWMVALIIEKIKFSDISRVLSGGAKGGPIGILRRAIKVRHIAGALFLAFLVVLPNAWAAMDAAIPTELKRQYDKQVYDIMPDFAKPADYDAVNGSNWYFGAFTYSLPLPTNYWPAAWSWFRTADSDVVPVISRPAFLSWWDYGFEAIQESQHPTVADNFQNAYQFAGSFIMSQSETDAVALFIVRIVEETRANDDSIRQELINHGVDYTKLRDILDHPDRYVEVVKNNPQTYGPFDSELSAQNAKYQAARVELSKIGLESLVGLYHDLRELTGFDIGYFAIDSRLFPFTALGYNIFYAPAKLSDRRIDPVSNAPIDFFEIKAVDANGNMHDLANVTPEITIVDYRIVYKDMFYNSMLYRAFLGYGPKDVGMTSQGLPGLAGSLLNYPSAQAWNMTHFRMVYRTAYYNPFPQDQVQNRSDAWRAIGYDEALELRKKIESGEAQGTVDASTVALTRGVVFIQYYDGAIVEGTVTTDGGRPYPDLWVTVLDEYGIPHQTVKTDQDGRYSVIAPFGKVEIVFSYGKLDLRTQTATEVGRTTLYVTYAQAMREKTDENQDGIWDYLISKDVMIEGSAIRGMVYWDVDMNGEFSADVDQPMEGATVVVENTSQGLRFEATMDQDGYEFVGLPAFDATLYAISDGHSFGARTVALRPLGNVTHNIVVRPASVNGIIVSASGDPASGLGVALTDLTSGRIRTDTTDANGVFSFDLLLSGAYSLAALDSAITLGVQEFNLLEGEGLDKDLSLLSAFLISGRVMIGDLAANNVTIGFLSADLELWTRTDEKGLYSLLLPIGQYTVSCRAVVAGVEMISIDFVSSSGGTMSLDPSLKVGNVVRGTVTDASGPVANAEFLIKSRSSG
ncbi:MAG: hypothetical protein FJ151_02110, partial [Euryarchaeota archaeon]|nr:hypothetical protein [Euryarchaeota archaeon]